MDTADMRVDPTPDRIWISPMWLGSRLREGPACGPFQIFQQLFPSGIVFDPIADYKAFCDVVLVLFKTDVFWEPMRRLARQFRWYVERELRDNLTDLFCKDTLFLLHLLSSIETYTVHGRGLHFFGFQEALRSVLITLYRLPEGHPFRSFWQWKAV